jgi:gliding motility-associated lipoprotein GldH
MVKRIKPTVVIIILILALASCNKGELYNDTYDITNSTWDVSNTINFNFRVTDTLQPYDVYINLRHTSQYKYRNLFLFIETTSPAGHTVRDTFECRLADKKGRWYGSGWGDMYENKVPYKRFVRFPRAGTYSIELTQAMRTQKLKHISDIGIEIKTAKKPNK